MLSVRCWVERLYAVEAMGRSARCDMALRGARDFVEEDIAARAAASRAILTEV